jgi:hypothetical protein
VRVSESEESSSLHIDVNMLQYPSIMITLTEQDPRECREIQRVMTE